MNFHYFVRAERCPRSAALRYGRYATLWEKNGYPDKPAIAALAGTVVHACTARIAHKFVENGCLSIDDPGCFAVLKQLGGYSAIIAETIVDVARSLIGNPRFEPIRELSLAILHDRIPALRELVQLQMTRIPWNAHSDNRMRQISHSQKSNNQAPARIPLREGVHFEVEVRDALLRWKGVVDFLEIGESACSIREFKTGAPSDDHILQLQVYALLWSSDSTLNPNAIPASQLALCYSTGEREVDLSPEDRIQLADSLKVRTTRVREAVNGAATRANLGPDNCPQCDVRHLCSDYWSASRAIQPQLIQGNRIRFDDVQLALKSRKGENTWVAECQISSHFPPTRTLLLGG